jgi:LPS sulfotransferase NodH
MPDVERPTAYLLCATPRSGSTLLCELLRSTAVAGVPESYFRQPDEDRWAERWGLPRQADGAFSYADYVRAAVAEGSTGNGVFGARVMWGSMEPVVTRLRAAGPSSGAGDLDVLTWALGRTRFVHLRRQDTVAQAVSWARAERTGFWHPGDERVGDAGGGSGQAPRLDLALVHRLVRTVREHDRRWRQWFSAAGVQPHPVTYEQLVSDPAGVTTGILDVLGVRLPPGRVVGSRAQRQADDLNEEWARRYRAAWPDP